MRDEKMRANQSKKEQELEGKRKSSSNVPQRDKRASERESVWVCVYACERERGEESLS